MTALLRDLRAQTELLSTIAPQEPLLRRIGDTYSAALGHGRTLYFCGNGGSCAEAQHLAAEYVVRFRADRRPLSAIALGVDAPTLTACGNDLDFSAVFARQLEALGQSGDVLTCLSTSGKSPNVRQAAAVARQRDITVVAITGEAGMPDADLNLRLPSTVTAYLQVASLAVGHWLVGYVEDVLAERSAA